MAAQVRRHRIASVLIAIPSVTLAVLRETIEQARQSGVSDVKIIPQLSELYSGRVTSAELRSVQPADLLHRDPVRVDATLIEGYLEGRTVLVTGAAGSIGSELCRQSLRSAHLG